MSGISPIQFFSEITAADKVLFGGKGCNLAVLKRAGFAVPDGFCVATTAWNPQFEFSPQLDTELQAAYARLGSPCVAVRSSATAEDSADTSFAGAHETVLNVQGLEMLREAIGECWRSGQTDRARIYRREHGLDDSAATMGVVVQLMVAAESAGVCFTINPNDASDQRLYIEAAQGLGDRVVSGEVMPDLFIVDRDRLKLDQRTHGASSLTEDQVRELARVALRVEEFFRAPQDIEWAALQGQFYLLQSRPITTANGNAEAEELETVRQKEITLLRACAKPDGTIWSNYNVVEVLPAPLPLTWSMMSKFMSAEGALGLALSKLGLMPGGLAREGVVQLICGRTYFNLDREIHLYFSGFPFDHPFEKLKADPTKASYPRPEINLQRAKASFWFLLPWYMVKMTIAQLKIAHAEKHLLEEIETRVLPAYGVELQRERAVDLRAMTAMELHAHLERLGKILEGYVAQFLQPTALAAVASGQAEQRLEKILGSSEAKFWIQRVVQGHTASSTVGENQALWEVAHGKRTLEKFLEEYGHRCAGELELAHPRWREDKQFLLRMIEHWREQGGPSPREKFQTQVEVHSRGYEELETLLAAKSPAQKAAVLKQVNLAQKFFPYRETGKHYWTMGLELMRQGFLALDEKLGLQGDIFWLQLEELPEAIAGKSFVGAIAQRKRHRERALKIPLPEVIFSDDLEAVGRKPKPREGREFSGLGVSMGVARGRAVVVHNPREAPWMGDDAILVCRSTDPGWTPLFVQAKGLVLERGGLLSHGAVVAREFGLPAVAGIEQATQFIQTGQLLFVDGDNGKVIVEEAI